jgi:putative hydrolase of the HAD superfamily
MENKLKAAIFDMDGLMIDTERVYAEGWVLGAQTLGFDLPQSFIDDAAGRSIDNNIQELLKLTNDMELVSAIRSVREEYFFTSLAEGKITLKPHLLTLLKTLRNAGIKTAVATSSYRSRVQKVFEHYQLSPLFDVTVTGDEVCQVKPNPEIYLTALNQLDVSGMR